MEGLEHKDQRLHAVQHSDWRDKLADLRRDLSDDPDAPRDGEDESERNHDADVDRR